MTPSIVYVHNRPIPGPEANSVAVMQMCAGLVRAGARVRLFTFGGKRGGDPFEVYGVDPFPLKRLPVLDGGLAYPALLAAALAGAPRGSVIYTRIPQIAAYATALGVRTVLEMHYPIGETRRGRDCIRHLNSPNPALVGVVAVNRALSRRLAEELPKIAGPIVTAPTGSVDFGGDEGAATPFEVGFIGSLDAGRGVDLIVELARRAPDLRFLIAGGSDRQRRALSDGAPLNLTVSPPVESKAVAEVLGSFAIGLAPYGDVIGNSNLSINTAPWMSPMKLVEYMSAGKAIIASKLPAIEELVTDGQEALLVPPGDVEGWLSALRRLNDVALRRSLGEAARSRYLASMSWDARARFVLDKLGL